MEADYTAAITEAIILAIMVVLAVDIIIITEVSGVIPEFTSEMCQTRE
jgi:hypothetical protein